MTTIYRIESRDPNGNGMDSSWRSDELGDNPDFATEAEALAAIASLEALGGEWAEAEYRVTEIEEQDHGNRSRHRNPSRYRHCTER